jgi:hypothetical protein
MKKILITLATTLACTFANAQSNAIEGNWGLSQTVNGITFDITFSIGKNSVTVTNLCSGNGTKLTAQVTSASTYTDSTLTVSEAKQDQKSSGSFECNVSTTPDTMNYSVQGNQLILTHDGSTDTVVLIKK